jgi:MoaD family protein
MALVKLYANLRLVAGTREIRLTAGSLDALLTELVSRIPALESHLLENGQLRPHVIITINGQNAPAPDTPLSEDDLVAIFPPLAGG